MYRLYIYILYIYIDYENGLFFLSLTIFFNLGIWNICTRKSFSNQLVYIMYLYIYVKTASKVGIYIQTNNFSMFSKGIGFMTTYIFLLFLNCFDKVPTKLATMYFNKNKELHMQIYSQIIKFKECEITLKVYFNGKFFLFLNK